MRLFHFSLLLLLLTFAAFDGRHVLAADEPVAEAVPPVEEAAPAPEESKEQNVIRAETEKINAMLLKLVEKMNEDEKKHFFLGYSNYNLQGTVKMVQNDVANAIEACGKNNPDMKGALEARHKAWSEAIDPMMKESEANLENMIAVQEYASRDDVVAIFKQVDVTREKTQNQIEKIPVTSPEACEYLMNKMDETQDSMINLLRTTLLTVPQAFGEEAPPESLYPTSPPPSEGQGVGHENSAESSPPADAETPKE